MGRVRRVPRRRHPGEGMPAFLYVGANEPVAGPKGGEKVRDDSLGCMYEEVCGDSSGQV